MDNYIGKMLDNRYEILESIGIGGMAVVYKARCHRLNRLVAIKILKDEFSKDAEFRRRFHAESQAVAMLSHPNIVSVYDVSHSGDTDYIVMELIDGITLKQYMSQKGQLNWRETLHFATQIAKALEHAHSRGIIHRDIKPHNIMILKDGSVKVADFGIARITSAQSTLTREALGSVHYISPEQARGSRVDKRSDLYSLGVVMYEMLTGRPPFDGDSPVAVAIQHINGSPVLPTELVDGIPKGLEQITMHAMTAAVEQRYASATEMLADLEEFRKNPNVIFDFTAAALQKTQILDPVSEDVVTLRPVQQQRPAAYHRPEPPRRQAERVVEWEEAPPRRRSGNRVAVAAGAVCIILAVVGVFFFLYNSFLKDMLTATKDVKVPNFLGYMYNDVINNSASYEGLNISTPVWVEDEAEYGTVIAQNPAADSIVKEGAKVTLTVSQGTDDTDQSLPMPNLSGRTLQYAEEVLNDLGVTPQVAWEYDDTVEKDVVISTSPSKDEPLQKGQVVILTVSDGPKEELVEVPALRLRTLEDALAVIDKAGLVKGEVRAEQDDRPENTVIEQSIEQGEMVPKGTVINLIYSSGPAEEQKPEDNPDDPNTDPDQPDENQNPDDGGGENNGSTTTEPNAPTEPVTGTKMITVDLPQDRPTTVMSVYLDKEPYAEPMELDTAQGQFSFPVTGAGTQTVEVYFDGVLGKSETITFGAG